MDLYSFCKFLHVLSAVLWVGGGFIFVVLGVSASRLNDPVEIVSVVRNVAFLANRFFIPSSLATLVFGLITAFLGSLYGTLWIWIGLAGFAATFATGALILGPTAERMVAADKAGDVAGAASIGKGLLKTAKFDYVVLAVVIADMVMKPGLGDWPLLIVMVVAIVAGALYFLGDLVMRPRAAA